MIAISDKLRHQVMKLAEQYEKPEFITDDPVQFPRRFGYKCSQEIVGFIAAWLAYGNRKTILSFSKSRNISFSSETVTSWKSV